MITALIFDRVPLWREHGGSRIAATGGKNRRRAAVGQKCAGVELFTGRPRSGTNRSPVGMCGPRRAQGSFSVNASKVLELVPR